MELSKRKSKHANPTAQFSQDANNTSLLKDKSSVPRAWNFPFEKTRHRFRQAARLLSVLAFLDRQHISRDLLQGLLESRH